MISLLKKRMSAMMPKRVLTYSTICLLAAVLLASAACGGDSDDAEPTAPAETAETEAAPQAQDAAETVKASKLAGEYELDEEAAKVKYDGKEFDIEGSVISSGTNKSGVSYVILQGSGVSYTPGTAIECVLTEAGVEALSRVSIMETVTIRGTVRGFSDTVKDVEGQFALFNSTGNDIAITDCSVLP
jgi:hypothetical protein